MWPRALTKAVGMEKDDFSKAFIKALQNDTVVATLKKVLIGDLHKEIQELKCLLVEKDQTIKELQDSVKHLELKSDGLEQYSRRNSLRNHGIEEKDHESPVDLIMKLTNEDLGLDMQPSVLDRVHRVGKKTDSGRSRPLLVKFATYRDRDKVYKAKSRLKGNSRGQIYVNEDLTRPRAQLLYRARQLKKGKRILDCWSHDGQVLIKTSHGRVVPVNSEEELAKLTPGR